MNHPRPDEVPRQPQKSFAAASTGIAVPACFLPMRIITLLTWSLLAVGVARLLQAILAYILPKRKNSANSLPSSLIPPCLCQLLPFNISLFRPLFSLRQRCSTTESRPRTSHASLAPFIRLGKDHQLPVRESPCNWRCPSLPAPPCVDLCAAQTPPL
ncbi:hypothetical protein HDV57DRAFT_356752 [Trichoderma longibrachiatum]